MGTMGVQCRQNILTPTPLTSWRVFPPLCFRGRGGGGSQFRTRGQTLWYSRYICTLWIKLFFLTPREPDLLLYKSEVFQYILFLPRLLGTPDSQLFCGVAGRVLLCAAGPVALAGAAEAVFTTVLLRHSLQLLVRPRGHFSLPSSDTQPVFATKMKWYKCHREELHSLAQET
jgi:hypothetical protein